ncbi:Heavy metal-associated isoprenylated plant protein 26 [Platanthera guangdongensis]|uniref:Heavy metal-associated isoprenylated plant protein 26 n=1 Tax=Platanthera guangdongensis TaxID=2320717 RepID=A0ABR2MBR4_9ASPA
MPPHLPTTYPKSGESANPDSPLAHMLALRTRYALIYPDSRSLIFPPPDTSALPSHRDFLVPPLSLPPPLEVMVENSQLDALPDPSRLSYDVHISPLPALPKPPDLDFSSPTVRDLTPGDSVQTTSSLPKRSHPNLCFDFKSYFASISGVGCKDYCFSTWPNINSQSQELSNSQRNERADLRVDAGEEEERLTASEALEKAREASPAVKKTMGELQGEKKPEDKKKAEEGKKSEDTAVEEEKKPKAVGEKKDAGKKEGGDEAGKEDTPSLSPSPSPSPAPPPPPPEEIILRVFMHCEGCARKVKRSLKGFDGVEDVTTDCRTHKVVIKGKKAAEDPLKVAERVQKKSGRKVELLIPLPSPKTEKKKEEEKTEEKPKPEKEAQPVISVILNVHMHCEACAQEIKKRILRMKGVQAADADLKSSQVLVKGIIDPAKLVDYVYKRTGKHAFIVNSEPVEKKTDSDATVVEEKSKLAAAGDGTKADAAAAGNQKKAVEEKANEGEVANGEDKEKDGGSSEDVAACGKVLELKKNEFCYYPRYASEFHSYAPQLFSDENPNACSVM